ncbi:MAG: hypothetical protein AAF720_10150 [Pseudomonadota bacterium]
MGSKVEQHTNNREAFLRTLGAVADIAAMRALHCLDDLDTRENDADHDRGARSAECLMRVATAAAALSTRLQKEDAHGENAETGQQLSDAEIERRARELTKRFERALQEKDSAQPQQQKDNNGIEKRKAAAFGNDGSRAAPRFLHGGRS